MSRLLVGIVCAMLFGALSSHASADDTLPVPRAVLEPAPSYSLGGLPYGRHSAYEVWQFYGVDRRGFFRPVVVYSPFGSYYLYNGAPYPWTTTHSREWMPYVAD